MNAIATPAVAPPASAATGSTTSPSEHSTVPVALIVHEPVAAGSFTAFDDCLLSDVERRALFREIPDAAAYQSAHAAFVAQLRHHVPRVIRLTDLVSPDAWPSLRTNPNHVFTRDSIVTLPWTPGRYIAARMREPLRRSEPPVLEAALCSLGCTPLLELPELVFLEGGDVVPWSRHGRRTLLVGHGPRSSFGAARLLYRALVPEHCDEVVAIELAPFRMNLDGCLLPVADDVALIDPSGFRSAVQLEGDGHRELDFLAELQELGMRLIEVTRPESTYRQACNAVCLGSRTIVYYDLAPRVARELREHGVTPILVPGKELVKGRGGPRCMSRPLY